MSLLQRQNRPRSSPAGSGRAEENRQRHRILGAGLHRTNIRRPGRLARRRLESHRRDHSRNQAPESAHFRRMSGAGLPGQSGLHPDGGHVRAGRLRAQHRNGGIAHAVCAGSPRRVPTELEVFGQREGNQPEHGYENVDYVGVGRNGRTSRANDEGSARRRSRLPNPGSVHATDEAPPEGHRVRDAGKV
uniref:(northern house mosquito) hypothetical protein n=1 Tax=Culex pipiens TaxID=7175 RepID=A0A8D8CQ82_CULPI